jgi:glycosyltransferase involved in cell wall biosynthesis
MVYIGAISRLRRSHFLINVINLLKNGNKKWDFRLSMIGKVEDSYYLNWLKKEICKKHLEDSIIIMDEMRKEDLIEILVEMDFGISIIPPLKGYIHSSPTKCIEYLSLGLPVIANKEIKDQENILLKSKGGLLVDYKEDKIVNSIESFLLKTGDYRRMGVNGRKWIKKNRNYRYLANKIDKDYSHLIGR